MGEALEASDGIIRVKLPGAAQETELDLVDTITVLEPLEETHGIFKEGFKPTLPFYADLKAALKSVGVDVPSMQAWQIWKHAYEVWGEVKKNIDTTPTSQDSTT
tara:strand:- start:7821 stop:8132 length:312 start_codon:yes stop_codon:yes gene_type:complete